MAKATAEWAADPNSLECLAGGGDMGAMMRQRDWSQTPLGPVSGWSQPLRSMVGLVLRNRFPLSLWWGPELVQFYNDPFRPILGDKHPSALGQSGGECWAEIWDIIGPMIEGPFAGGPATGSEDLSLLIHRSDFFEETHFRVAYSPVPDESVAGTGVGGVLATVSETTAQVQSERQRRTLQALGVCAAGAKAEQDACENAAAALAGNPADVPFSLFYLLEEGTHARLVASSGFPVGSSPPSWPLAAAIAPRQVVVVETRDSRFGALPTGPWEEAPRSALVLPLAAPDQEHPYGVLIAGISPHRALDQGYRSFFELAAAQVVTAIRNARAFEEERKRAEALVKLDRAKTAFFSNVSHEFRTPLALMIGPLEDALASPSHALGGEALEMAHRNSLRLLKLVNSLLDFARMEAGRVEASYQATDLAPLTADLASQFRATLEKGGLRLVVNTEPPASPAFVDREMWEKIVLNLLSNAFKHTFHGEVVVQLAEVGEAIELTVRDTGIGIHEDELSHVFDRFYRVRGARTRSHEGTGIGLALVKDLVKLHGGHIQAQSRVGEGTCVTVSIPKGSAHLPADRIEAVKSVASTAIGSAAFINDAISWLPSDTAATVPALQEAPSASTVRVLLADDNADMREYLRGLLSQTWTVEAVADGWQALEAVRRQRPQLLVADVMMPGLDGLGLTRALRADPTTRGLPIILLSARTGEEAITEGLATGANDYMVKPFSARELLARVRVQLEIARGQESAREHALTQLRTQGEMQRLREAAAVHVERERVLSEAVQARDDFLSVASHELKTPLATLNLQLATLERSLPTEVRAQVSKRIEGAQRQAQRVGGLVDLLLDVSRVASGRLHLRLAPVDLSRVVLACVEEARTEFSQAGCALTFEPPAPVVGQFDQVRVGQLILNLLSNAAKYARARPVEVRLWEVHGRARLEVMDHGVGVLPEDREPIFQRFERRVSARHFGGLGLGLWVSRQVAEAHGGSISISETPGGGATFTVDLPLGAAEAVS